MKGLEAVTRICYLRFQWRQSRSGTSRDNPSGDDVQSSKDDTDPPVLTVLFAEDDPLLRDLISTRLGAERYRVIEATSGDEALPVLQAGGIDVLVTDISMPGALDGWELAEEARRMEPRIAIVYSSSGPVNAARQVSGSLYLRKPYHPDAIVAAIRHVRQHIDGDPSEG